MGKLIGGPHDLAALRAVHAATAQQLLCRSTPVHLVCTSCSPRLAADHSPLRSSSGRPLALSVSPATHTSPEWRASLRYQHPPGGATAIACIVAATVSSTERCTSSRSHAAGSIPKRGSICGARKPKARAASRRCATSSATSHAGTTGCSASDRDQRAYSPLPAVELHGVSSPTRSPHTAGHAWSAGTP